MLRDFVPAWMKVMRPKDAEEQLVGFRWAGVGFYPSKDSTVLVVPATETEEGRAEGDSYLFCVYNNPRAWRAFHGILELPIFEES